MKRNIAIGSSLIGILFVCNYSIAFAQTIAIKDTNRGYYRSDGVGGTTVNYIAGDSRGVNGPAFFADLRDFFVFDLSTATQPIVSAKLALFVPADDGYSINR
jgi:hypothetical protein